MAFKQTPAANEADIDRLTEPGGPNLRAPSVIVQTDRKRAFRRAKLHTVLVRILRGLIPLAIIATVGIYGFAAIQTADWGKTIKQLPIPRITAENLTMDNPTYSGFTKDGGAYVIAATTAQRDFNNMKVVKLEGITGDLTDANDRKTRLVATRGTFETETNVLNMRDGINITSQDGLNARLATATVETKTGIVVSSDPVQVKMPAGRIDADTLYLNRKTRFVTFEQNVVANLTPRTNVKTATKRTPARRGAKPPLISGSDAPIQITSTRLDVDDGANTAVFKGSVKATQDGATLSTQQLDVEYENKSGDGQTNPAQTTPANQSAKVKRIIAKYPVLMTQSTGAQVTANSADFDAINETALLIGNVVMSTASDQRANADRAELDSRADTALLVGNVTLKQGQNTLRGDRLFIDRAAGRSKLTNTSGRQINARFVTNANGADQSRRKTTNANGAASVFAFQTTPDAPIDIDSNRLDVDDNAKRAIFSGRVTARQGAFTINAGRLTATYSGSAQLADPAAQNSNKQSTTELQNILADGKVNIQSQNGQTAKGDRATFDVKKNLVLLIGNVTLSQGSSIVQGDRLSVDMTTGLSRMETKSQSDHGGWAANLRDGAGRVKPSPGNGDIQVRGGRTRAVFYPNQIRNGKKQPQKRQFDPAGSRRKQQNQPKQDASSWAPQTIQP